MLSIGKVSPGRAGYYEKTVARGRDDYYSGAGEAPGDWAGRGARALGLTGKVSAEQFDAMIAGRDPADATLRRMLLSSKRKPRIINGKRHDPVAAYDLTFSSPKSVSVLFATADPATARELVAAHDQAVKAALGYLEERAVYTRRGRDGTVLEQGDGLIAAAYRHRMSRSKDPQLHTHVVAANLVQTPSDEKWRTLHAAAVYRHARTAGVLYQAHLRAEISERLGLRWGPVVKGAAELDGIPNAVLREFSRRRIEIEEAAKQQGAIGIGTKAGAEALALQTRQAKDQTVRTSDWRIDIEARAQEHGWDRTAIHELLDTGRARLELDRLDPSTPTTDPSSIAEAAATTPHPTGAVAGSSDGHVPDTAELVVDHLVGPAGLTELQNTFGERDALTAIAELHQQGRRIGDVRGDVDGLLRHADVLDVRPVESAGIREAQYTTADLVQAERRLVDAALQRVATATAVVSAHAIDRALAAADRAPTPDQQRVVRAIATSGNGVDVVEALAGTGKTFTAGLLREIYARDEIDVLGVAPTGRAARELSEVGIPARTLHAMMFALDRDPDLQLPQGGVIVLDEAGMAPTRLTERFLRGAAAAEVKVIAIGDSGQLPSVQAGGWMRQVGRQVGAHRLTEVLRQRDPEERRMLGLLHDHPDGGAHYLKWLDGQGRLEISTDTGTLIDHAIADWSAAVAEHGIDQAALISRDQQTRAVLNERARGWMLDQGRLGEQREYGTMVVAVGERVIARRNDRQIDVDNGTRGTVTRLGQDEIELRADAGAIRTVPAAYVEEHVEHAYALTGHGMQAATVEWAAVVARTEHLTRGWSYTALSRARDQTRLYLPAIDQQRQDERAELAPHDTTSVPDRRATLNRAALRMRVRDDEDLAISQLLLRHPPAGTATDQYLDDSRTSGSVPQEWAAERAQPLVPPEDRVELVRLSRRLQALRAQRDPARIRLQRRLVELDAQRTRITAQRDRAHRGLDELPDPAKRRFRPTTDEYAPRRATLTALVAAADEQLHALAHERDSARSALGVELFQAHGEARELETAIAQTDRRRVEIRDRIANQAVTCPLPWATELLGPRPSGPGQAAAWDDAVRAVVAYELEVAPDRAPSGVASPPTGSPGTPEWQLAQTAVRRMRDVRATPDPEPPGIA